MSTARGRTTVASHESFEQFAGACAIAVGVGEFVHSIAFAFTPLLVAGRPGAFILLVTKLLATPVLVAVYLRLRETGPGFALWGLLVGLIAAVGTAIHRAFYLAVVIKPPERGPDGLPNPINPRGFLEFGLGFLEFGLACVGTAMVAWLILRSEAMPRRLGQVGIALAGLRLVIYLGRLNILDPWHPLLLGAGALGGFVVNPTWWLWLGRELRSTRP